MAENNPQDRSERFRRFIELYVRAFADCAERGYRNQGPGVVVLNVAALEGGDEFRAQPVGMTLHYLNRDQVVAANPRPPMLDMLSAYHPPEEAVIVASYPDGSYDATQVAIRALAQSATGAQVQYVPQSPPESGGPGGQGGPQQS